MYKKNLTRKRRILIVDDNPAIHADFKKILIPSTQASQTLKDAVQALFGDSGGRYQGNHVEYEVDVALSGQEGHEKVNRSIEQGWPYLLAFVDMKMPNGWNGIETTRNIWNACPDLQIVICTAFSDFSWDEIKSELGYSDRFLILKKPFDNIEVQQMAQALTSRAIAERQLLETDAIRLEVQQIAHIANYSYQTQDDFWTSSDSLDEIFGRSLGTIRGLEDLLSLVDEPYQSALSKSMRLVSEHDGRFEHICRITRGLDHEKRWVSIRGCWEFSSEGNPIVLKGTVQDNTKQFERLELLRLLEASVSQVNDAVIVTDTDLFNGPKILFVNKAFLDKTGYQQEQLLGQSPRMLHSQDSLASINSKIFASLLSGVPAHMEVMNYDIHGNGYWIELDIVGLKNEKDVCTHYVEVQRDITEKKRAAAEIERLAYSDTLTGLPNRRYLNDQITLALNDFNNHQMYGALYFFDIDRFKDINDAYGHQFGDLLLIEIASRLQTFTDATFIASRIGGDEFVMLMTNLSNDVELARQKAIRQFERVTESLSQSYSIKGVENHITLSVGISLFGQRQISATTLFHQADMAMHHAKANGRNTYCLFNDSMEKIAQDRSSMANELRMAIGRKQLCLHYQPQVNHKQGIIGAEALIRWQHDVHGNVSPALFIPLAEESGHIVQLGEWVLKKGCEELARWATIPHMSHLTLSVNISPLEFLSAGFAERVLETIEMTGAPIHLLKLELTENVLVHDIQKVESKISMLRACGIHFSIDDFGTGYSSLRYLKRLSLDQLKIDQSFIRDIDGTPNSEIIARAITSLAQSLELEVIAEGVETQQHEDFLVGIGCTIFQGYLYSRPVDVKAFESYVLAY